VFWAVRAEEEKNKDVVNRPDANDDDDEDEDDELNDGQTE
jgi:hypothetical protein